MTRKYNYLKKAGRPSNFNSEILKKAEDYIAKCEDEIEDYVKSTGEKSTSYQRVVRVKLPSKEGLALYLNVGMSQIQAWEEKHPEFMVTTKRILLLQKERLATGGLSGDYNPQIAKLLLASNHGVVEKTQVEQTIKDDTLTPEQKAKLEEILG